MAINEGNQGDWQKLDPRVADVVREQEEKMLTDIMGVTAEVNQLFENALNPATVAGRVVSHVDASIAGGIGAPDVRREVQDNLKRELEAVRQQEAVAPQATATERIQRRVREFASAVRKAIPADILDKVGNRLDLPAGPHTPTIDIDGKNVASDIDLSHPFWLNRIQDKDELVASLEGVEIGKIGIKHTGVLANHPLSKDEAEAIADSDIGTAPPPDDKFWRVLLRHNTKTLLSDEQVSSLNVNEAVQLVMNNDQVRKAIAPPDSALAKTEMDHLVEEKNITSAVERLEAVDMPNLGAMPDWQAVRDGMNNVDTDLGVLSATPGDPLPSIGVAAFTLNLDPGIRAGQIAGFNSQLRDKKRELQEIDAKMQRYCSVLETAIVSIDAVKKRKAPGATLDALTMIPAPGTISHVSFEKARTPGAIATELKTKLSLRSSPGSYDADIAAKKATIDNAESNPDNLTGREAVLKVFDVHNRQVERLDARKAEEATHTRYARNEMNKEEHDAREEAVEELTGRDQRVGERMGNPLHNLGHGRPQDIVCKLAESNSIGASTTGTRRGIFLGRRMNDATPKWTELSYPRLITAYAALKKLNEDSGSPIHLRNSSYFKSQMAIVSNLLATRYAEQVERDFGRETESEEQRTERKGQGERNRKQRLIRLLVNNPLPSEYDSRADSAIAEAAGRCNRVRRATSATVGATVGFAKNRAKNVFLGEKTGTLSTPLTLPARGLKAFWKFGTTPLGS